MGFFFDDTETAKLEEKKPTSARRTVKADVLSRERGCETCALRGVWPRITSAKMRMHAPAGADILVLGEAPGEEEDREGRPFVGESGKLLRSMMPHRELDRLAWQNAVRCRPDENRTPTRVEIHACSEYLDADIAKLKPKAILGVGGVPLSAHINAGDASISRIHGTRFPVRYGEHVCWYYPVLHPSFVLRLGGEQGAAAPVLRADLRAFFRDVDTWPKPRIVEFAESDVRIIATKEEAFAAIDALEPTYAVDFETTALRPYVDGAAVISAAFADRKQCFAFAVEHPEQRNTWGWAAIERAVRNPNKTWVAHQSGMELSWIWWQLGAGWAPTRFEDTMGFARLYHNRETLLGLGIQSRIHLGTNVKDISNLNATRIMTYPLAQVLPYNGLDAKATILHWHQLAREFESGANKRNYERILATQKSIVAMELAGLPADLDEARKLTTDFDARAQAAMKTASTIYEVREFERQKQIEFNIGNPDHVGVALVEFGKLPLNRTAKGTSWSTDDESLSKHADTSPLVKEVLAYREYTKLASTYARPILERRYHGVDSFFHPGYTSMLTATLRLSSEDPNIQNWPKRKHREIRRIVKASDRVINEWLSRMRADLKRRSTVVVAFDYGQLEARVIAMMCRDRAFCKAIIDGYDIHGEWRDNLVKKWPDYLNVMAERSGETDQKRILKAARDGIKSDFVFLSCFGGHAKKAAERLNAPLMVMQDLQNDLWKAFPGIKTWLRQRRGEYIDTGSCTMLTKRQRHAVMTGNEPINNPIQGSAADIVLEGMNALVELAIAERDPYLLPRINIHDDLTFFLPDDDEDELFAYIQRIAAEMSKPRFDWITVPLVVEVSIGPSWAHLEEIAKVTGEYFR